MTDWGLTDSGRGSFAWPGMMLLGCKEARNGNFVVPAWRKMM
jgi:hypothetical protein